jgi:hypothetical protein
MSLGSQDATARYAEYTKRGWRLEPSSYQIRDSEGKPGGWVAQVHVLRDTYDSLSFQPLLERDVKIYESVEQANQVALRLGLEWLDKNAN